MIENSMFGPLSHGTLAPGDASTGQKTNRVTRAFAMPAVAINPVPRLGIVAALLVGLLLAYGPVQNVHGANITITVTTTDDGDLYAVSSTQDSCNTVVSGHPCTLRGAMLEGNQHPMDVVTIMVPSGVYSLTLGAGSASLTPGALYASANMTIIGAGPNSTIIDGSAMVPLRDSVFSFGNSSTINISGMTIRGGSHITGGGIRTEDFNVHLTINNCIVKGNSALYPYSNPVHDIAGGGGIFNTGYLNVVNSYISANTATGRGGGIYSKGADTEFINSIISGNVTSVGDGGGIANDDNTMTLTNSAVNNNTAGGSGGGIYNSWAVTLNGSTIQNNTANSGGSTAPDTGGGGIYTTRLGTMLSTNSTLSNNIATYGNGGGFFITNDPISTGQLTLTTTTISGNAAPHGNGGGFYTANQGSNDTVVNSTISGNTALSGGGVYRASVARSLFFGGITLTNVTIAANSTGIVNNDDNSRAGTVTVQNSILANTGTNCALTNAAAKTISQGYNLESANTCGFSQSTDLPNTNPALGPLANNGGSTLTHLPATTSPVLDRIPATGANCPATDQRGISRPQPAGGLCDIGAVELIRPNAIPAMKPAASPVTNIGIPPVPAMIHTAASTVIPTPNAQPSRH